MAAMPFDDDVRDVSDAMGRAIEVPVAISCARWTRDAKSRPEWRAGGMSHYADKACTLPSPARKKRAGEASLWPCIASPSSAPASPD